MELDIRKQKILNAIIQNYQETGEPVGSRTIAKYLDLKISAATIRNEMADLEELGLIIQPHTSAGRIPTDKGYRLYVDQLMQKESQLPANILAANTNYATMVTGPRYEKNKLRFIQLSPMEKGKLLAVVVLGGNIVRNNILDIGEDISPEDVLQLNLLLNKNLTGLCMEEINLGIISRMKEEAGAYSEVVSKVLDSEAESLSQ